MEADSNRFVLWEPGSTASSTPASVAYPQLAEFVVVTNSGPVRERAQLSAILDSLRWAANYNSHELAAPTVILWPDEERLWSQAVESLRAQYPLLWTLGEYDPGKATAYGALEF